MKNILVKGGHIVDPAQNFDKISNLLIEDGKISDITDESPSADIVIDATGKIVSPGFIDMHTHEDDYYEDEDLLETHMGVSALKMGVTTFVGGNCGDNTYYPDKYLDIVDRKGYPINVIMLAGHSFVRNLNGHTDKYKPVSDERIAEMASACREYLNNGCLGVSFGVKYIPGTTWEEITALSDLCRHNDKIVSSHVRMDVDGVFDAAAELAKIGETSKVKVQFSHIGSMGGYGQMKELLAQIQEYRDKGIDIMCDCYPYDAFSTSIGATTYDDGFLDMYQSDYDSILIVNGKYKGQRATKAIFDELRATAPDTGTVGYFMKDEDVEMALVSPLIMVGSDGVRRDGLGHPRASGTFPRFIKNYIKTGKLSLSAGIEKMSTMAAQRLNLKHKGNLIAGSDGDVVIFDMDRIEDCATYENGQIPPKGIDWVIIGGQIALKDGKTVDETLGRSIRR